MNLKISILFLLILLLAFSAKGILAQPYQITQSNISNGGGGQTTGGLFKMLGAIGQPIATTNGSTGGLLNVRAGFITPAPFTTTASQVSAGGRVLNFAGIGIPRASVTVVGSVGVFHTVLTNSFGYYQFTGLNAGQTYVFSVSSKEFQFDQDTQVVFVNENLSNINFTAVP